MKQKSGIRRAGRAEADAGGPARRDRPVEVGTESPHRRWGRLAPLILLAAGAACYANSFAGAFVLDDERCIVNNASIRELSAARWLTRTQRPVTDFTLALNYHFSKLNVWSYHGVNLLIHALAGLTLYGVVRRTLRLERFTSPVGRSAEGLALAVSLLWLVHPLQTQSVTYVVQRGESLMGLFYLLTLYCVIRGSTAAGGRARPWYAAAVLSCGLGMGSKAVMVTAPAAILIYDRLFLAGGWRDLIRRRGRLYCGLATTWGVLLWTGVAQGIFFKPATAEEKAVRRREAHRAMLDRMTPEERREHRRRVQAELSALSPAQREARADQLRRRASPPPATMGFQYRHISPRDYFRTQCAVVVHYLRLSIWPAGQCLDYRWPVARDWGKVLPQTALLAALLAGTAWGLWRRSWAGFAGVWFFLILLPTSSFIPFRDTAFEHRMYLPLASICAAAAALAWLAGQALIRRGRLTQRAWGGWAAGLTLLAVAALGTATARRNRDYASVERMWADIAARTMDSDRAFYNLGQSLMQQGKVKEAADEFRRALDHGERQPELYYSLALALSKSGRHEESLEWFEQATRSRPSYADAYVNWADALEKCGRPAEAEEKLELAMVYEPGHVDAWYNRGNLCFRRRDFTAAERNYRRAVELAPARASAHFNLGTTLEQLGRPAEALKEYQQTLQLEPGHVKARKRVEALE